ncbi:MAG: hypothetical protein ACD_77C00163G0002 [uncultured bacterium]|nr:MAG: hypothetical protein ACD_77C00163G0002 [uncultured bacterium]
MKKYRQVFINSFAQYFAYRLNFILWRVRIVISIIMSYFLWTAVFTSERQVFGYSQNRIITYILLTIFVNGIVLSTQTAQVATEINFGTLSKFLIRPLNFFAFNMARDLSDKVINTFFSIPEFILLFILLKPPIIIQTEPLFLILFITALALATILYFEIGMILSFIGFWSNETWAPRFLFFILVAFLSGNYFPLDILPQNIYRILEYLPFTYLVFYPLKIYLGELSPIFIYRGFGIVAIWTVLFYFLMQFIWQKGLKIYTSEGQ